MTSTIATHNFGKMQHAAYEAQAMRPTGSTATAKRNNFGSFVAKITAMMENIRGAVASQPNRQLAVNS